MKRLLTGLAILVLFTVSGWTQGINPITPPSNWLIQVLDPANANPSNLYAAVSGIKSSFPPSGCSTANGVIFNNATPCDTGFTYAGSGAQVALSGGALGSNPNLLVNPATATANLTDFQLAGASKFSVRASDGQIAMNNATFLFFGSGLTFGAYNASQTAAGAGAANQALVLEAATVQTHAFGATRGGILGRILAGASLELGTGGQIGINGAADGANSDTFLTRSAAAAWRLGAADAAAPVAQTLGAQSVVAGTSNTAGADWILRGSQSTGTGVGGKIKLQTALTGSTGSTVNATFPMITINPGGATTSTVQFGDGTNFTTYDSCTALTTSATGIIACTASAMRFKDMFPAQALNLIGLDNLRTDIPWKYKDDVGYGLDTKRVHIGLFADDVEKLDSRCVVYRNDGQLGDYEDRCVIAYLVADRHNMKAEIELLKKANAASWRSLP